MISESGLQNSKSLRHLHALGFRGFLIGEALMRAPDPEAALRNFISGAQENEERRRQATVAPDTDALVYWEGCSVALARVDRSLVRLLCSSAE